VITEDIRKLVRRAPFEPFEIRLADGRAIRVLHPDFILIPPGRARTIHVADRDGRIDLVNSAILVSVQSISQDERNGSNAGGESHGSES